MQVADSHPAWHRPRFELTLCGQMTDRERLGLPDCYVETSLNSAVMQASTQLRTASTDVLLETLAAPGSLLAARIACGNLLALAGDPRICVERPEMVTILGGEAEIGLPSDETGTVLVRYAGLGLDRSWIEKECPRHRVTLEPYRLARYPVTNAEYRAFLLDTGHPELPSSWHFRRFPQERANHPVYTISAEAADAYARWLAQRTGHGFRLPTEAEWEWAAAGPEGREFPWGEGFDASLANTAETGLFSSSPVGAFPGGESAFGLADMAGNVEEYVADVYAAYPGGSFVSDHLVQMQGSYRVARGGSFARFRDLARTRRRHGHNPKSACYAMGFRLAESP
jgi:formylglycine-generating enzyme required for sulfatase activity